MISFGDTRGSYLTCLGGYLLALLESGIIALTGVHHTIEAPIEVRNRQTEARVLEQGHYDEGGAGDSLPMEDRPKAAALAVVPIWR